MKRELKLNFGELRLVEERVAEFEGALADIDAAAAYFDDVLGEQESEAVEALMERYREMEEKIRYFQDILSRLKTLLGNYISDMESHIMPKDENAIMLVDRNDIWWNMKQIEANINIAGNLAAGRELRYYRNIDTTPSPPHIYEGMSPEAESAAWERYRQNLRESQNRKENYNKLRNFCDGMVRDTRNRLEEIYDRLEELYKKHVVEFENTDDDYKREAEEVYDACTDDKERIWDAVVKTAEFLNDIEEGAEAAVVDFISGILGLAVMLAKIDLALRVAAVTVPFGTTPQWVKDTGKEAVEGALGIVQILKNPGRALAAIGQKATDVVEEKGIAYALSYTVTDLAIGRLVDTGIGKLKSLAMGDDFADVAKILDNFDEAADVADDFGDITKAVEKIDDAAGMADDVAALGNIDSGTDAINSIITDGSHLDNGKLKPNVTYKTGEHDYIYKTNEDGLIVSARTDNLQLKTHEGRLKHNSNTYGKETGDHAGHLFGDRFGGSPELDNLVSQAKNVNLSEYKVIENQWEKALKNGQKVTVDIKSNYGIGSSRPISFDVSYTIDNVYYYQIIYN